jgi:hypothetical protein
MGTTLYEGQYGTDNGHDFKVIATRGIEVQIEYVEDGRTAWFQDNRFNQTDDGLRLQ